MPVIPVNFGQSVTTFRVIGTSVFGSVVLGHSFGVGVPNVVDGANAIHDSWQAMDIMAVLSNQWQLAEVELTIMTGSGPISGLDTRAPLSGAINAAGNIPNSSILVRKITDTGGRPGRGRMYVPGHTELDTNEQGVLTPAYLALCNTVYGDMLNDFASNDVFLRLLHTNPAIPPSVITGLAVQPISATQRRRLRR